MKCTGANLADFRQLRWRLEYNKAFMICRYPKCEQKSIDKMKRFAGQEKSQQTYIFVIKAILLKIVNDSEMNIQG